ncbi:HbrB-like protein [Poronia punctata]|nr:HbrB-like protein [Poronia punctata]
MQPSRPQPRAPGSFSPHLTNSTNTPNAAATAAAAAAPARPMIRRIDTSPNSDTISVSKSRGPQTPVTLTSPSFPSPPGRGSPQNFSRPGRPSTEAPATRNASPLTLPPARAARRLSQNPGLFEPSLPSASMSNLSQIAAQAAMQAQQQQNQQQQQQQQPQSQPQHQHSRHRSQTVPFPGAEQNDSSKRPTPKPTPGPRSPPMLSLTEASAPRDNGFGSQGYRNGLLGSHAAAATAAANIAFPRTASQTTSPVPTIQESSMPPPPIPEKPAKSEKSKVKLFSRPKKIDTKGESKERPLPSPGKIGSALASLQRGNYSTTSLADSQSFYNLANSSTATVRHVESPVEREGKEKEKEKDKERKHHFLSRQKHKLSSKEEYHLPLSSAASNSRPVDPHAPSSLYNFHPPPSPGPNSALGKSVSGLDLRHGGRALREKRKEEKLSDVLRQHDSEVGIVPGSEWPGPGSLGSAVNVAGYFHEPVDSAKYGLNSMALDDAWPYLKAKLLVVFEGEDVRQPVEDLNRVVTMHIQYCIQRRAAHSLIEDLLDLLRTGFASLDHALRQTSEDRVIPALVELWVITFTNILPYLQAVFLPLDLEFSGAGSLLSPQQARDFWSGALNSRAATPSTPGGMPPGPTGQTGPDLSAYLSPAHPLPEVRQIVLAAYRDILILPRYEKLKAIFSRLSLEHLPYSLSPLALASPAAASDVTSLSTSPSESFAARPGTAMSLDPSVASYNSTSTTVFGNDSNPSRSRAISNVSFGSGASDPASANGSTLLRPFTPQMRDGDRSRETLGSLREQNVEDSKQVTEMAGRLLQCMSVLASVGSGAGIGLIAGANGADEPTRMISELGRLLKLNWLGRGRTGRNRRGIVGGRVKRPDNNRSSSALHEGVQEGVGVRG